MIVEGVDIAGLIEGRDSQCGSERSTAAWSGQDFQHRVCLRSQHSSRMN